MSELKWRRSTRSEQYNCVEVTPVQGGVLVRDSKDPEEGRIDVSSAQWWRFLARLRAGRYDA